MMLTHGISDKAPKSGLPTVAIGPADPASASAAESTRPAVRAVRSARGTLSSSRGVRFMIATLTSPGAVPRTTRPATASPPTMAP